MSYEDTPAPMAAASQVLDIYQEAISSTFRPDVYRAVRSLNELVGRAREQISRLKKNGEGMYYCVKVYSGDHSAEHIEAMLKVQHPAYSWVVEASGDPVLYFAYVGDAELPEMKALFELGKKEELEVTDGTIRVGIF